MSILIRPLEARDEAHWRPLWDAYLVFYEQTLKPGVTEATWARLMGTRTPYWGLVAEEGPGEGDDLLGFAIHQTLQSTWCVEDIVYLEDLYVAERARCKGVGRALIEAGIAEARERGAVEYLWQTDKGNHHARRLYDKITGGPTDWIKYEVEL